MNLFRQAVARKAAALAVLALAVTALAAALAPGQGPVATSALTYGVSVRHIFTIEVTVH
ncbi:hypothetical protein [Streptomyces sp. NPDC050504]|uniref:hypothetical protein n=1 Tax=Streptomyces sp. NPDC050504 TaxID=3365618 RepID=UPI00379E09B7